jgi:hypothetical protein
MEPEIIWKVGDQGEYGGDVVTVTRVDDLGDPSIDELRVKLPMGTEITIWQGERRVAVQFQARSPLSPVTWSGR